MSKALCYIVQEDLKNALREELKLAIIRINPIADGDDLVFHESLDMVNISNLDTLIKICKIHDFKKLFDEMWSQIKFNKIWIKKGKVYKYLSKAIKNHNYKRLNKLSSDLEEYYFD